MSNITFRNKTIQNSELRYVIRNNMYFNVNKMSYDFDLIEILSDDYLVGYISKYNILALKNTEYIDIFICSNFRNKGLGSLAINKYLNETNKNKICVFSNKDNKSKFLLKNGFVYDEIYIYKNLYKFEKEDINE